MLKKKKLDKPAKKEKESGSKTQASAPKGKKKSTESASSSGEPVNSLGKKFTCHSCGTRFYDLNKVDKICPKCGADQNAKPITKQKSKLSKMSEYDVTEDEVTDLPEDLIAGEEIEMDEEAVIDEEEV
jgi:predicted RNA-binding Zn-ribbon protein involved in translation (DUF1610 family)